MHFVMLLNPYLPKRNAFEPLQTLAKGAVWYAHVKPLTHMRRSGRPRCKSDQPLSRRKFLFVRLFCYATTLVTKVEPPLLWGPSIGLLCRSSEGRVDRRLLSAT